ncbi:FAD-binding oxidoreductase [Variovorax sp. J22R133]|uniref:FAD-binding oxidoreductase n=1 Tax=Variovorax brevis TaxID=3053503 RepID=UPI0025752353|nr:FAD-binding oxidoreductase [Variovorax sp. J22R133]MDM0112839.1 FAD-binding oxidoreductase [Variovorax sp. J22R133]
MSGVSPWHDATVQSLAHITPRIVSVVLQAPLPRPVAGQHVDVRLTAPDGYAAQRSYSIASAPHADGIELIIEKLDDGEVSPFFHDVVQPGDTIELRGPLGGHFIWQPEDGGPLLLVGGGSGIAPLMAMVRQWRSSSATTPLLLIYSARTWAELAFGDELLALQEQAPNFMFVAVTTREPARRKDDLDRRIDAAHIEAILTRWDYEPASVYVCGSNRFVEAATTGLLDAGVPATLIRTERYGGAG